MLHAVIRSERDALHFFGEVNGYNLETLRHHVRQTARDASSIHLWVQIDPSDKDAFSQHSARWLPQLERAGGVAEIVIRPQQAAALHGGWLS